MLRLINYSSQLMRDWQTDMQADKRNIVILISGSGSNMQAIASAAQKESWHGKLNARIACVISNTPNAVGLQIAQALGIPTQAIDHRTFESRDAFDGVLQSRIDTYAPTLVVLAGFMRIITPGFVRHYAGRLINIHPSLLPAFTGLDTHQRALDAGCRIAGATVHHVTADLDHGPILAQAAVPVLDSDDTVALAARVLSQEHLIYPQAIRALLQAAKA